MKKAGCGPDTATYNTLMAGYIAAGDPGNAVNLWRRMRAARLRPDTRTYTNLIKVHVTNCIGCSDSVAASRAVCAQNFSQL